jgi:pSer/pThr/pTyr-binding forkhead associated (FHA) protein
MLQVTLLVVGGDLEATEIPLRLPAIIGRGRDVAVNLSHPLVSRRHCELVDENGQLRVRDLGSLNGTFVGSERIVDAYLRHGELLTVGTATFRASYQSKATKDAAPAKADVPGAASGDTTRAPANTVCVEGPVRRPAPPQPAVTDKSS